MIWNLIAARLAIVAGVLPTVAATLLFMNDTSLINGLALGGGIFATLCGVAWTVAELRK
jgi:hypothetical protein